MIIFMLSLLDDKLFNENSECGPYPISIQMLKYKFNYWMITIHPSTPELESCLLLSLCSKSKSLNENCILAFSCSISFYDSLFYLLLVLYLFDPLNGVLQ